MTQQEKQLAGRVIQWAYRGTGYNGLMPEEQVSALVYQFDCHDWESECRHWGNKAMALDPIAYQPNEGATWEDEVRIFKAQLLRRIGEYAGDTEPYIGRTNALLTIYNNVCRYHKKS